MEPGTRPPAYGIRDLTININTLERPALMQAALASLIRTTPAGATLQLLFNGTPHELRETILSQAEGWRGEVNIIHLEETLPISESHNTALAGITTRLVNFMGDDDIVLGNRLPALLDAFNTFDPTPLVVTSFAHRIAGDPFKPAIGSKKDFGPTSIEEWEEWRSTGKLFELVSPAAVIQTERLRAIGGFEEPFGDAFDTRIFTRLALDGPVVSVPDRQFGFRIHQGSLSAGNWTRQHQLNRYVGACQAAMLKNEPEPSFEDFAAHEKQQPRLQRVHRTLRERSRLHFRTGGELVLSGRRLAGARHLVASLLWWPPAFVHKIADQIGR